MKFFALFILLVLLVTALSVAFVLARLPGEIAKSRRHPQASAITAAGWCSLLLPLPLWPLAIVWAYYIPTEQPTNELRSSELQS